MLLADRVLECEHVPHVQLFRADYIFVPPNRVRLQVVGRSKLVGHGRASYDVAGQGGLACPVTALFVT